MSTLRLYQIIFLFGFFQTGHYPREEIYENKGFTAALPSLQDRNTSQFWIFQNMETAIVWGEQAGLMPRELDAAFNLTVTYRQDSDVIRRFGDMESLITDMNSTMLYETVMGPKQPYGSPIDQDNTVYNTLWYVSNCNRTSGAVRRMNYVKELQAAGLKGLGYHLSNLFFGLKINIIAFWEYPNRAAC